MSENRWIEVSPSEFEHEAEGLAYLQERMPTTAPFRGWSNFEFRDTHGRWHEIDAMILNRNTLYIVELKYYRGTISGTDTRWRRENGWGSRSEDSPIMLAQKKARLFASRLKEEFSELARSNGLDPNQHMQQVVPFVKAAVFLHHPHLQVKLSKHSKQDIWGLDETEELSGLPGISGLIYEAPHKGTPIGRNQDAILAQLVDRLGVERREREIGNWILHSSEVLEEGPDWYDVAASYSTMMERQGRIRILVTPRDASKEEQRRRFQIAQHEFRLMNKLSHDGLILPVDFYSVDEGAALIYDYDPAYQRLDLWLADQDNGVILKDQLEIIRQIAEALDYAHRNTIVHRDLSPRTVWVKEEDNRLKVRVSDWQAAGVASAGAAEPGVTSLIQTQHISRDSSGEDVQADLAAPYRAPEGRWIGPSADRMSLDVFSLGALAFAILTGTPPAESQLDLAEKLREQGGLDVTAIVPQLSSNVRQAILEATSPRPTDRTETVQDFLNQLENTDVDELPVEDPLEATSGAVLANGRFLVKRRLGKGSTAIGLEVQDRSTQKPVTRVLKLALNDKAAARIRDEADVMAKLPRSSRLVSAVEGPIDVDGRPALLLNSAGPETLAELLRSRRRLSLDLVERFGNDLLQALAELDTAGIAHRDIKPSNLGVRPDSRKAKHLVLFDFSASRANPEHVEIGTAPYLDPFLGTDRPHYDSSAERYSAAVVLFEMATGRTPYYGDDPYAAPTAVKDEVTFLSDDLDPAVEAPLTDFFRQGLARDATHRFDTVQEMRSMWQQAFAGDTTTAPEDADDRAYKAQLETPLKKAGLSARALSALEHLKVATVGDLAAVDPVRLTRLSGVAQPTRNEVRKRAKEWRDRLGDQLTSQQSEAQLPTLREAAERLRQVAEAGRTENSVYATDLLLGRSGSLDAFATQAELGGSLEQTLTPGGTNLLLQRLQEAWASEPASLQLLQSLENVVDVRLNQLGQVATPSELAQEIKQRSAEGTERKAEARRLAHGLLRFVVDRRRASLRSETDDLPLEVRRRGKRVLAIARDVRLLDTADSLGTEAETLVNRLGEDDLVSSERALEQLRRYKQEEDPEELWEGSRPIRLAAQMSSAAAATSIGELYPRDLQPHRAVRLVLGGIGVQEQLSPREIHNRVDSRFPTFGGLPNRPGLDTVLRDAGIELIFDETSKVYVSPTVRGDTTGLYTQVPTYIADPSEELDEAALSQRLRDSVERRSYLVLGTNPDRMDRLVQVLQHDFSAQVVDLTALLLEELHSMSEAGKVPAWKSLAEADAQPETARPRKGLQMVVDRAIPKMEERLREVLNEPETSEPVVLTNPASLVRYGHGGVLRQLSDLSAHRSRPVWVLAPQFDSHIGAVVDGMSIQTSPQQFITVDAVWIDPRAAKLHKPVNPQGAST